jgi:antitoxin component YwqK of YwqJK toxin-antitoxin module
MKNNIKTYTDKYGHKIVEEFNENEKLIKLTFYENDQIILYITDYNNNGDFVQTTYYKSNGIIDCISYYDDDFYDDYDDDGDDNDDE